MSSDTSDADLFAELENAEFKEAFDEFDKVSFNPFFLPTQRCNINSSENAHFGAHRKGTV